MQYTRRQTFPSALDAPRKSSAGEAAKTRAIVNLGSMLQQRGAELKKERDITIAHTAYNEFQDAAREQMFNEESGLLNQKGEAIYDLDDRYNEWFDKVYGDFMAGRFDTDAQANRFDDLAQGEKQRNLDSIAKYIRSEHGANKKNIEESTVSSAIKEMGQNPFDDKMRVRLTNETNEFLSELYPNEPELLGMRVAAATEAINSVSITALSNTHPWLAYKKIKTMRGEFTPQRYKKLTGEILSNITKLDNMADEIEKERLAAGDYSAWIAYRKGKLSKSQLNNLADGRIISMQGYNGIANAMRQNDGAGPGVNNSVIVGEIAENIGLGKDQSKELDIAMANGQIRIQTYLSYKKDSATKQNQQGMRKINDALKPTGADKYKPDLFVRHAEALSRYEDLKVQGYSPDEASDLIWDEYVADLRRTALGLPRPSFLLTGDKLDMAALENAKERTIAAQKRGRLPKGEVEYQMELIQKLMQLSTETKRMQLLTDEQKKRVKK